MSFRSLVLAAAGVATFGSASVARAQIDPDDTGLGTKLGMAEMNNSGEVGTVTLFDRGRNTTLVVLQLASEPPGRAQRAQIQRGRSCATREPRPAYGLAPAVDGLSRTLVQAPEGKLLSGNYVVAVSAAGVRAGRSARVDAGRAASAVATHDVSCGELYR
jgi:hypothetical protein